MTALEKQAAEKVRATFFSSLIDRHLGHSSYQGFKFMLDDLHIHDFYRDAGRILLALYQQFPAPATVYVEDISGPDTADEFGLHSPRHLACLGTMTWLKQCGYIEFSQLVRQEAVEEAVLTHRSFLLLVSKDAGGNSNAQLLNHAVREGSSSQLQDLMTRLMREITGL